jgi:hypothetical protein
MKRKRRTGSHLGVMGVAVRSGFDGGLVNVEVGRRRWDLVILDGVVRMCWGWRRRRGTGRLLLQGRTLAWLTGRRHWRRKKQGNCKLDTMLHIHQSASAMKAGTNWSKLISVFSSNCAENHGSMAILLCYMPQQSKTHHIEQKKQKKSQYCIVFWGIFAASTKFRVSLKILRDTVFFWVFIVLCEGSYFAGAYSTM